MRGKNAQMQPNSGLTVAKKGTDKMSSPQKITEGKRGTSKKREQRKPKKKGTKRETEES